MNRMGTSATLDPVPAGAYRVGMKDGVEATGEFLEVDRPRRLVFMWGWTHQLSIAPGSSRVEVSFEEEDGGTRVILGHHDLPDDELRTEHGMGWRMYLDRLATLLAGGDPGPDPNG